MAADQGRGLTAPALGGLLLLLGACGPTGPFASIERAFGPATEGRERPPGLDGAGIYPALGTVPARPDRPDPATRQALTDRLARDRETAREELPMGAMSRGSPARGAAPGLPGPPAPAAVGPMVAVPPSPVMPPSSTAPAASPVPSGPAAPQAPPMQGPPPLPAPDLLAPGGGPPPLPSQDLLAPRSPR
jgi:hypothetical protein